MPDEGLPACFASGKTKGAGSTSELLIATDDIFAEAFHHFGNAPAPKENQDNGQDNQPMKNTQLTHDSALL